MATRNRRSSVLSSCSSTQSSSSAKTKVSSTGKHGKAAAAPSRAEKRTALTNVTNQGNNSRSGGRSLPPAQSNVVPYAAKLFSIKKGSSTSVNNPGFSSTTSQVSSYIKQHVVDESRNTSFPKNNATISRPLPLLLPHAMYVSDGASVSLDESMSTCDSLKSPEFEYLDSVDVAESDSLVRKTCSKLCMSDNLKAAGTIHEVVDVDNDLMDPQFCATMAFDIYTHLRESEVKKRPSVDYMERTQKDINPSMRAILIDWLVEVVDEYSLVPDTLFLAVNYVDRYLSGNPMDRQRLQLLGVACMMIAAKYEEVCAPRLDEFCYVTENTYSEEEVLEMESAVLNYLKFEMTTPTPKCFLRRFIRAAQGINEAPPSLQLEFLANYITELSILEYSMLCYAPSMVAASAVFLAKYIHTPSKRPWNAMLRHYTHYEASDLQDCVTALHSLCRNNHNSTLPAIREKYSQHRYKFVAKKYCSPSIPADYFQNSWA